MVEVTCPVCYSEFEVQDSDSPLSTHMQGYSTVKCEGSGQKGIHPPLSESRKPGEEKKVGVFSVNE